MSAHREKALAVVFFSLRMSALGSRSSDARLSVRGYLRLLRDHKVLQRSAVRFGGTNGVGQREGRREHAASASIGACWR